MTFTGIYHYKLDSKKRLFIPPKLRRGIKKCFLAPGIDDCIYLYPAQTWTQIVSKFDNLSLKNKSDERAFKRAFLCNAIELEIDNQGRIVLPHILRIQVNINKDIVIIGVSNRLEIWPKEKWEKYYIKAQKLVHKLANKLEI